MIQYTTPNYTQVALEFLKSVVEGTDMLTPLYGSHRAVRMEAARMLLAYAAQTQTVTL